MVIFQALPPPSFISTSLVSKHIYSVCLRFLYASFKGSCNNKQTLERFQSFLNTITRDRTLGRYVKSVIIDEIDDSRDIAALRSMAVQLLSQASNLQRLAIAGDRVLLFWLKKSLLSDDLCLQRLQEFRCVNCGPEIWHVIHHFPRLSRLSLKSHSFDPSTIQLPPSSLPIEHISLEGCDLGCRAICDVIRSCKRLLSFRYRHSSACRDPSVPTIPLNAQNIYEPLLIHKDHLEELVLEDLENRIAYCETPKFGSFGDFAALHRLGLECNTLSVQASLPPSLRSIAIRHCGSFEAADVLLHLACHPLLETIRFDQDDEGPAILFQQLQSLGRVRKDIQVHLVFVYAAYRDSATF
jgi:hypothetical protein